MITPPHPKEGQRGYRLVKFFCNKVNFCEGFFYDTETPKPENRLYTWFYNHWLWPFVQNGCICCNTVRGLLYGVILGYIMGKLL